MQMIKDYYNHHKPSEGGLKKLKTHVQPGGFINLSYQVIRASSKSVLFSYLFLFLLVISLLPRNFWGLQDGWMSKGFWHTAWQPEFYPLNFHKGSSREPTPYGRPLTYTQRRGSCPCMAPFIQSPQNKRKKKEIPEEHFTTGKLAGAVNVLTDCGGGQW